jgi:midasin (ATPase involved in ribosome maturation)
VDRAPFEILAALLPLMESRTLPMPQQQDQVSATKVHPEFRLFGTSTTLPLIPGMAPSRLKIQRSANSPILDSLWKHVFIDALSYDELIDISTSLGHSQQISVNLPVSGCLSRRPWRKRTLNHVCSSSSSRS